LSVNVIDIFCLGFSFGGTSAATTNATTGNVPVV